MKKAIMMGCFFVILFLTACQSTILSNDMTGNVVGIIDYGSVKEERMGTEMVTVKEFNIVADRSAYRPDLIEVNRGDFVRLIMYSSDADTGFVLPAYGINEYLKESNYKTIEFVADQAGTFTFYSNVYSGPDTKNMNGNLIVSEVE
ncbi:MAG: hypothetical protein WC254_00580 [Candidatus Woesearchaeota archaeon]|jgi:nitrosocyanin